MMKERKRDLRGAPGGGVSMGRREMGGAPKVMQWTRLKPVWGKGVVVSHVDDVGK